MAFAIKDLAISQVFLKKGGQGMELKKITETCFYFESPVNIGYVKRGETGLLIDSGLDAQTAKKVLRELDEKAWPLTHLFITHAHSDHFGGAHELRKRRELSIYAPTIESDVLHYPKWEPLYLFHGAEPPSEMRNKFLEGKAVHVNQAFETGRYQWGDCDVELISLPGHSDNQMGILVDEVLYAADSYMAKDVLNKHRIPFLIDVNRTLDSLKKLLTYEHDIIGAVPGHGVFETDFGQTVRANSQFHEDLLTQLENHIKTHENEPLMTLETIVATFSDVCQVDLGRLSVWGLYRTAITAYLIELVNRGSLIFEMTNNFLCFKINKKIKTRF
jgi:glyoxylase-like metal-dependent hydrolase (beta-lactamase superfamily II)